MNHMFELRFALMLEASYQLHRIEAYQADADACSRQDWFRPMVWACLWNRNAIARAEFIAAERADPALAQLFAGFDTDEETNDAMKYRSA